MDIYTKEYFFKKNNKNKKKNLQNNAKRKIAFFNPKNDKISKGYIIKQSRIFNIRQTIHFFFKICLASLYSVYIYIIFIYLQ